MIAATSQLDRLISMMAMMMGRGRRRRRLLFRRFHRGGLAAIRRA